MNEDWCEECGRPINHRNLKYDEDLDMWLCYLCAKELKTADIDTSEADKQECLREMTACGCEW